MKYLQIAVQQGYLDKLYLERSKSNRVKLAYC